MRVPDFETLDDSAIDKSVIERVFTKLYHQQRARLNHPDQNIDFLQKTKNAIKLVMHTFNLTKPSEYSLLLWLEVILPIHPILILSMVMLIY